MHEKSKYSVLLCGELERLSCIVESRRIDVQAQIAALDHGRSMTCATSDQRLYAYDQLIHFEGFRQIVIGAGVEAGEFFVPAPTCSQDQHRHLMAAGAPMLQHAQAVDLRQA
jgi:hypothetical protein